jgi:protein-S-isoprenylcysteine O-methyltransferase Ste14
VSAVSVLVRAVTYTTLFVGVVLVFIPARLLSRAGLTAPAFVGPAEAAGLVMTALGASLAAWCILTFALLGRGTPAPFDPPRRLVVRGPYRFVRNPMYLGAATALAGAALYYGSVGLAVYAAVFLLLMHALVVWYEEPALRAAFGTEYERYRAQVHRWYPRVSRFE